ncbi:HNH endonuclease signature motif containing protein [Actinomycetospora flava]|uniref:DUF222 domain-containing protein n=1 Tax=Actinomycetospora flava TaxID=3129232 RepID=A0ABU8MCW7_9PSEU
MSESLGGAEREVFDRARAHVIAQRRGYYQRLQDIAALDELGAVSSTGYRSLPNLVADLDNVDHPEAKRLVDEAGDLCARTSMSGEVLPARLPATADALAEGLVDPAHVRIVRDTVRHLAGLMTPPPPDELAGVEQTLADKAQLLPPKMLRRLAKAFVDFYDPDGAAPSDGEDAGDEMHMLRRRDGSLVFKGRFGDPLEAEKMVEVVGVLSARAGSEDQRSLARRQADALKDLIDDARGPHGIATTARGENDTTDPARTDTDTDEPAAHEPGAEPAEEPAADAEPDPDDEHVGGGEPGLAADDEPDDASDDASDDAEGQAPLALIPEPRRPEPDAPSPAGRGWTERPGRVLLTVTIDHRWLCEALQQNGGYGTLDSGHHVDAATIRRWACDAEIIPMILGSKSEPLDVGRRQRTAPDAIRRALNHRDGGCAFPGCDRRPRRCQAHHVRHWYPDGDTALDNMCLLCRYHHQLVHHGHWTIEMINGQPWFTPPWYIDTERQPRLGGRARIDT